jgi:nucleoside-triphosphatase THEP1
MNAIEHPAVAAIVHSAHGSADRLLLDFAHHLRERGLRVRGLVQDNVVHDNGCGRQMILVDLEDGKRFLISQDLGPGSVACCVDPGGVAAASVALRRGLTEHADLVIANRFGELEAGNSGLAAEMLALMAGGIPLLTVVSDRYLDDWRRFSGNAATELPPQREALQAWFDSLLLQRKTAPSSQPSP